MKREVQIRICGEHCIDGQWQEPVITETIGNYIFRGGSHYLQFHEQGEPGEGGTESLIRFSEEVLRVSRKGAVISELELIPEGITKGRFGTGAGLLSVEMKTEALKIEAQEKSIEAAAEYVMLTDGTETQRSRVTITVIL